MLILPLLTSSHQLDKSNIGNANTAGMSVSLGLTSAQYTALLTLFYCIYLAFQWVRTTEVLTCMLSEAALAHLMQQVILFKVFPVHIWVAFAAVGWGTASIAQVSHWTALNGRRILKPGRTIKGWHPQLR